jgi:pimeloyl-ACP methyl ester carboxylesterase
MGNDLHAVQALQLERAGILKPDVYFFPGQGRTAGREGFDFGDMADEIAEAHEGPLHIIALAIGAYTAAELLLRYPERIASVVIACSSVAPISDDARKLDAARGEHALTTGMEPLIEETLARWFTPAALIGNEGGPEYARAQLSATEPAAWNNIWSAISRRATIDAQMATRITVPVTVVVPLHDTAGAAWTLPPLHHQIPRSRLIYVDGPHMLPLERPDNLVAAIDGHFSWLAEGGERIENALALSGR